MLGMSITYLGLGRAIVDLLNIVSKWKTSFNYMSYSLLYILGQLGPYWLNPLN